jgi:hypothetical protein
VPEVRSGLASSEAATQTNRLSLQTMQIPFERRMQRFMNLTFNTVIGANRRLRRCRFIVRPTGRRLETTSAPARMAGAMSGKGETAP